MRPAVRITLSSVGALALAAGLAPAVIGGPAAAKAPAYHEYVALGDSWSADVVFFDLNGGPATRGVPVGCAQSQTNYPKLVAKALGVTTLRDATCGSATTKHFTQPQSVPFGGTNAPQFDRLTKDTDLVTMGIGGNDAGFAGAALSCISALPVGVPLPELPVPEIPLPLVSLNTLPTGGCKERFTAGGVDVLAKAIKQSKPKLVAAIKEIKKRSPQSRVLVVNYLAGIPEHGCWPAVPITDPDMNYLFHTFNKLNRMVAKAAKKGKAELVDTFTPSIGRHVCDGPTTRVVEGLGVVSVNDVAVAVPAHPNAAGARAQAAAVLEKLRD